MKTSSLLWQCAAFAGVVSAASSNGYLWTVDTGALKYTGMQVSTTSSSTAERIIARRKGVTDSAYIPTTDETVLSDLNEYGGYQLPLFGAGSPKHPAKLFIRISGYTQTVSELNALPDLWIEDADTALLDTFEARFDLKNACEYHIKPRGKEDVSLKYLYYSQSGSCKSQREIEMLPPLLVMFSTIPTAEKLAGKGISAFHRNLIHLSQTENIESTLLVLPSDAKLKKAKSSSSTKHNKRAEEPLEIPTGTPSTSFPKLDTFASNEANMTLPKNIPQCFSSMETCTNTTNNCSGHGSCRQAHRGCYKCSCGTTIVRTNEDGTTKSVQWGGNACQKKDISTQFFLFAGFGIFFTAVVAGSIGMLFSMGSEELPSVIGAGVVGPRAQR